jgi:hypothetical protein
MPNYLTFLKSKKNFLISWFTFHLVALFVNFFGIEGGITETDNLLTTKPDFYNRPSEHFYPFVKFAHKSQYYEPGPLYNSGPTTKTNTYFHGIFYQYDISEFLAYTFLIFLILYIVFQSKKNTVATRNS